MRAASSASAVSSPGSRQKRSCRSDMRPYVGSPVIPHKAVGCLIEPPVSVPVAHVTDPVATAAAEPRIRPYALCILGLPMAPALFSLDEPMANSSILVLPRVTTPVWSRRSTTWALRRGKVAKHARAAGSGQPVGTKNVFMGNGDAGECLSVAACFVSRSRLLHGAFVCDGQLACCRRATEDVLGQLWLETLPADRRRHSAYIIVVVISRPPVAQDSSPRQCSVRWLEICLVARLRLLRPCATVVNCLRMRKGAMPSVSTACMASIIEMTFSRSGARVRLLQVQNWRKVRQVVDMDRSFRVAHVGSVMENRQQCKATSRKMRYRIGKTLFLAVFMQQNVT